MSYGLSLGLPFRSLTQSPSRGGQLIPDPSMTDAGAWDIGAGVTFSDPGFTVVANASAQIVDVLGGVAGLIPGARYEVTVTITSVTAILGGIRAGVGGNFGSAINSVGVTTQIITAGATNEVTLERGGAQGFEGVITGLSLKHILWG